MTRAPLLLLSLVACKGDVPDGAGPEPPPPIPLEHCGSAAYELLAGDELGDVVFHEDLQGWDIAAEDLAVRVAAADVGELEVLHGVRMWRYRYTTQDRGQKVEATALIALPSQLAEPQEGAWPVVLMLHGFMGATDACAPSGDLLIGPALPAVMATRGYAVIAPDYIGMAGAGDPSTAFHAPLVGEQVALGSWDAWRAGVGLLDGPLAAFTGDGVRDDLLIHGASQGGHAAFFTELYGPYYAPEADVVGVVAATPAHDLTAIALDAVQQWSDRTGLTALAMVGMRRWYGVPAELTGVLTNEDPTYIVDTVDALLSQDMTECAVDIELDVTTVEEIYDDPYLSAARAGDLEAMDPWSCFFARSSVTTSGIERLRKTPILASYGEIDPLVAPELQEADFAALCDDGWMIEQTTCQGAGHVEGTLWSLDEQLAWMEDRLAGRPLERPCQWSPPQCCSGSDPEVCVP